VVPAGVAIEDDPNAQPEKLRGELSALRARVAVLEAKAGGETTDALGNALDALRASEERNRAIIEHAQDGIFLADSDGGYLAANPAGCRLVGYTEEELLGMNMRDLLPAPEVRLLEPRLQRLRDAGGGGIVERHLLKKDGHLVPV